MRTAHLRERGLILGPSDTTIPTVQRVWRQVLVETVGGLDDGADLYIVGSADSRHVFTLTISPGTTSGDTRALRLPLAFEVTAQDRTMAEGECQLEFSPSDNRTTNAELLVIIRWSTSRLRRRRTLGRSSVGVDDAVGRCYQAFLAALGRESMDRR